MAEFRQPYLLILGYLESSPNPIKIIVIVAYISGVFSCAIANPTTGIYYYG
jgi:hypothetical protein